MPPTGQIDFGADFGRVIVALGSVDVTLAPGRALVVKVAPPPTSEAQVWLAYGTTGYPTRLLVG
ncbi:MAG: hypothetical protein GY745_14720 [Actinomycetia bacterium]|nr:hypothetical protein [Actinomycetes bacterium]MCP3913390.1 hypothetical protein [Actinomycetes bacterium]MCP4086288.1 hypothetical protein [Actinomycetes bacterium]